MCFRKLGGEAAYAVCRGLPDTGTSRTILHERVLRRAGIDYDPRGKEPITTANGTPLRCKGNVRLQVKVHGVEIFVDALVSSNLHAQCLVSWSDLQALGIIPADFPGGQAKAAANSAGTETVESIIEEFPDVFDETVISPMSGEPMHVHLRRDDAGYRPTRVSTARRVPLHFMEEAEKTLKWFLDSGVIIEVPPNESTEWCSPGFFVPKPNGKVRLVVDYRDINKFISRPVHPFPSPRDVVRGILPTSKFFMKLDAVQGYYQLPLDEESSYLTTFLMPTGRYRFLRAPMGMSPSSDEFCFRTDRILAEVPGVLKIVDDALLQAPTYAELCRRFRVACEAAREGNLTLSREKVAYGPEIEFGGYIISDKGVKPDPKRLAAVAEFPRPVDVSSLRGFLGLANQLGFFVPDLAHLSEELRQLLKKGIAWQWLEVHEEAFTAIKKVLTSSMVVKTFDPMLKTELLTDASRLKGLGYALIQREADGRLRLIQCSSRSLSPAETRYATIELECLAIQWAVEDARHYLLGCQFEVLTDHRPLEGVFLKPLSEVANARLLRIRMKTTDYAMKVTWTPGKTHLIADALSRAPVFGEKPVEGAETNATLAADPALQPMFEAAEADSGYVAVVEALMAGKAICNLPPEHPARVYKSLWDNLSVHGDTLLVLDGTRIVVPKSERKAVLGKMHISHPGIGRTRQLAQQLYYWPGMSNDIKTLVDGCEQCQVGRASQAADPLESYPEPTMPMQSVSMDLCESHGQEYLVMCDRYSGMTWVYRLKTQTTAAVLRPLEKWFTQFGYPQVIVSDGGPQFRTEFKEWCMLFGIEHLHSSPYHSQSNGLAEAAVKSTKALLEKSRSFDDFQVRLLEWRNVPSAGCPDSPAQRFFGRRQRGQLPVLESRPTKICGDGIVPRFRVGDRVRLQNPISKKWDTVGEVVTVRASGRSFGVRRDDGGPLLERNQRFMKAASSPVIRFEPDTAPAGGVQSDGSGGDGGDGSHVNMPRRSPRLRARAIAQYSAAELTSGLMANLTRSLTEIPQQGQLRRVQDPLRGTVRLQDQRQRQPQRVFLCDPQQGVHLVGGSGSLRLVPPEVRLHRLPELQDGRVVLQAADIAAGSGVSRGNQFLGDAPHRGACANSGVQRDRPLGGHVGVRRWVGGVQEAPRLQAEEARREGRGPSPSEQRGGQQVAVVVPVRPLRAPGPVRGGAPGSGSGALRPAGGDALAATGPVAGAASGEAGEADRRPGRDGRGAAGGPGGWTPVAGRASSGRRLRSAGPVEAVEDEPLPLRNRFAVFGPSC